MTTTPQNIVLAARLQEVLLDGQWVANTNLKAQLQSTTHRQATCRIGSLHSIAELAWHLNYYLSGVLLALKTGVLDIHDKYSFDCPPFTTEADWHSLCADILANSEEIVQIVAQLSPTQLAMPFVHEKYGDYQRNIDGMIAHCYYHLGQMVLIKKLADA